MNTGLNAVTKITGQCGCGSTGNEATDYAYDGRLNVVYKKDALLNETYYAYGSDSNLTSITDVLGKQTFTYNSHGQILTQTDRMNGTTTNTYDTTGNLLTTTDPLSNTTTITYTSGFKQPATITDARSNTTTLTYDTSGRLTQVTDANGKDTDLAYNARARVTSVTNALSEVTTFGYDSNNRLNKITYPDTNEVNINYDINGRRTSVTDENGHATTYTYDGAYRLTGITDALSHTTSFGYDTMSNMTSRTDALGNVTNYEYDDFDRVKKIKYPLPTASASPRLEESFTYNKIGEIASHTDTAGHTTSYSYAYSPDPTPTPSSSPSTVTRVITITDALSNATKLTYNARMQLTKVKDALNQEYNFTYDALGRTLTQAKGTATPMSFSYDAVGNRTGRTDYNGNTTTYSYDDLNRLTAIAYGGASSEYATYGYDDLSRLTSAVNQNGTVSFTYDNRGRKASETDVFGHVIGYGYDDAGNRTALTLDSSTHTTYAYDNANRLTTLTDAASNQFTFAYDNANRLISKAMPNGVTATFTYDGMSRLKRLKYQDSTPTTLYDDQYTYNTANQISQIAGLSLTRNYSYDNIDRLTGMTDGTNTESYSYDAVGNRSMTGYTTSSFNRLTAANSATFTYNNNGSRSSKTVGSVTSNYAWSRENQLLSVSRGTASNTFAYDALGRRISATVHANLISALQTNFTYDGQDVILDWPDYMDGGTRYQNAPGIDNKLESSFGDFFPQATYYLQDHLGSTVKLTDSSGSVSESNSYNSFGNASNSSFSTRYQFTGREYEPGLGLQYSRARWYDPQIGRFISEDPIGFKGRDVNLYGYVWNNPINILDPFGLQGIEFLPSGSIGSQAYEQIRAAFEAMKKNCSCKKSFEGFGLDLNAIDGKGILVGSSDTLANPNISNGALHITQDERDEAIPHINRARAFTMTTSAADPRPHVFFDNSAYQNYWSPLSDPARNLRRNLAHELIHVGGIPGRDFNPWLPWRHDLDYLDNWLDWPYTNLIENCSE